MHLSLNTVEAHSVWQTVGLQGQCSGLIRQVSNIKDYLQVFCMGKVVILTNTDCSRESEMPKGKSLTFIQPVVGSVRQWVTSSMLPCVLPDFSLCTFLPLLDREPQADVPRQRQGASGPRGGDHHPVARPVWLCVAPPPPGQPPVVLRQPQHAGIATARHAGRGRHRSPGQAGLVNNGSVDRCTSDAVPSSGSHPVPLSLHLDLVPMNPDPVPPTCTPNPATQRPTCYHNRSASKGTACSHIPTSIPRSIKQTPTLKLETQN